MRRCPLMDAPRFARGVEFELHPSHAIGQLLARVGHQERFGHLLDIAFHERRQRVDGEVDAMVRHAALREVVRADLGTAVAGRHLRHPVGLDEFLGLGSLAGARSAQQNQLHEQSPLYVKQKFLFLFLFLFFFLL